jgi:hypothetical protein
MLKEDFEIGTGIKIPNPWTQVDEKETLKIWQIFRIFTLLNL